jgi:hypothetical protein
MQREQHGRRLSCIVIAPLHHPVGALEKRVDVNAFYGVRSAACEEGGLNQTEEREPSRQ